MSEGRKSYVYILVSTKGTMYVGVTSDLEGRVWQQKTGAFDGFTKRYKVNLLVHHGIRDYRRGDLSREADQGLEAGKEGCFGGGE